MSALRGGLLLLAMTCQNVALAQDYDLPPMDSVEISLLTCQPHDEVYSLYGHTAIRYHELTRGGIDASFNYGVFNYNAPFFVIRFVFGLTDYELGAYPTQLFEKEYRQFGSMVTEQVLNLTNDEKLALRMALVDNLRPANRVYRYNYFYNNCTTKARDIIEQHIKGKIQYSPREDYTPTYRKMVHNMTRNNLWSRFGNDLLLGVQADKKTTMRQQEFLPDNLLYDFDHAKIYANGKYRPLVKERRTIVPAGIQMTHDGFPLSPVRFFTILLAFSIALFLLQWQLRRAFIVWDVLLMLVCGIIGVVLFLMLFSQHPTVRINLQLLFFNPLHLFYIWPVIKGKKTNYWYFCLLMGILLIGGCFFQMYAEGILMLALCLLLQAAFHAFLVEEIEEMKQKEKAEKERKRIR